MNNDNAQWFSPLGKCRGQCGRAATGQLMSDRNANLGQYCERCAKKRIKACHRKGQFLPDYTAASAPDLAPTSR
jgi:hypothetical protein